MTSSRLRICEKCHQPWPRSDDHDLRGFAWLDPLPRRISISNADLLLHDGVHGDDRYLFFEAKMPWEPPLQKGQNWLLRALARQRNWTVRILHGRLSRMTIHRVGSDGVERDGRIVQPDHVRASVSDWLNGQPWRDQAGVLVPSGPARHVCGWARVEGAWTCVQDYYAKGEAPETGCGAMWTPAA
jgi:hypothetical protein